MRLGALLNYLFQSHKARLKRAFAAQALRDELLFQSHKARLKRAYGRYNEPRIIASFNPTRLD